MYEARRKPAPGRDCIDVNEDHELRYGAKTPGITAKAIGVMQGPWPGWIGGGVEQTHGHDPARTNAKETRSPC